ncbi:MAG: hypothetical protein E7101_06385 [Prevotella ruminicola]|uniref:Uncharacterized protein n=1 Tax=Xylanibacter ruminicola TaxID=839 RepID=A0A9D5P4G1_XYLRU|nr:hypothetical protein [Xylanibacter ruminicola]
MTEVKRIQKALSREGRTAYNRAKENSSAFIAVGNSIYRMSADGTKEKISDISSTRVKAKCKNFSI